MKIKLMNNSKHSRFVAHFFYTKVLVLLKITKM
jgi:hypothetical protein